MGEVLDSYSYEYNANHSIKNISSNAGLTSYDYDLLEQLTYEKLPDGTILEYDYDPAGNRKFKKQTKNGITTTVDYTYNGSNQILTAGTQSF